MELARTYARTAHLIENTPRAGLLFVLVVLLLAPAAHAGIADSPIPNLDGASPNHTKHIYSVPGVISVADLATYFGCTSLEKTATMRVGVELFGGAGGAPANDAVASSLSVAPGATVIFGTNPSVEISISSDLGTGLTRGSARVLSTSTKLACTAFIADRGNAPPTSMVYLTIIKKTKQKGE